MRIVFRCDASNLIGSGHVMRCLTLADGLRDEAGFDCNFICRDLPGHLGALISDRGHGIKLLQAPINTAPTKKQDHASWAGVSWREDAADTIATCYLQTDWFVVDHYAFDQRWEEATRSLYEKLLVIDDLADRPHNCNLLLDQNIGRRASDYQDLLASPCQSLIGPKYTLLRPEFSHFRRERPSQLQAKAGLRVLLCMGGMDNEGQIKTVLAAILMTSQAQSIIIDIIISNNSPSLPELRRIIQEQPASVAMHVSPREVAPIMAKANMAITACGFMAYELACLGVPMLLLPLSAIQSVVASVLQDHTNSRLCVDWQQMTPGLLAACIEEALNDLPAKSMQTTSKLFDGQGTQRVVNAILTMNMA
ncbi:MAG: UDP-2,4-diacetamido-2,4,6-trideoxy-beta-L-altropyranose hydrolase [Cyanobacteriota bacterium]